LFGSVSFAELTSVRICGVMGMATNTDDEVQIHREFAEIRRIFDTMKQRFFAEADYFNVVSMGMTDDYPIAITEGSNMVRIGSYIFGPRQY
ncbi:MAG: alanine racemase, partial [Muribaculaceae bacterium]|nr:alanine racemase [Muribaculaceae bacterium]